jgi:hypothetical protein
MDLLFEIALVLAVTAGAVAFGVGVRMITEHRKERKNERQEI